MTNRIGRKSAVIAVVLVMLAAACGGKADNSASKSTGDPASSGATGAATAPLDELRIFHPETLAFAAPFSLITDDGPLSKVANRITTETWTTPDMLRGLLTSNKADVTAVPTNVAANLVNNGVDVKLAAVLVWGLLYVLGPDGTPAGSWQSLKGQTVMIPFKDDMPDLIFRSLAKSNGLVPDKDFTIEYYATPPEAVFRLIQGKGKWAVLPEHVATIALDKAKENGHAATRVINMQQAWAKATGGKPRIPQAGIVVPDSIAARTDVMKALYDELEANVAAVNAADASTVAKLANSSKLSPELVRSLIPRLNLEVVSGADARKELVAFYAELAKGNPAVIGGKLPPANFYLADPR